MLRGRRDLETAGSQAAECLLSTEILGACMADQVQRAAGLCTGAVLSPVPQFLKIPQLRLTSAHSLHF